MGDLAQALYDSEIRRLPPGERLRLVELITRDLADEVTEGQGSHSILELHGLGAEAWRGVDAQEYVDRLRDEWDSDR